MITIRIESDQPLKDTSKNILKRIFETSKDLKKDLSETFSKGFTQFDVDRFTLTLGNGSRVISFINIKGFTKEAMANPERIIKNSKYDVDY